VFEHDNTAWCVCHNDLVAANCFVIEQQAQFIDWEYARRHNPWFDLAAIVVYLRLDDRQANWFLQHYRGDWSACKDEPIYHAAQCALLWGDILWHLARFGESFWPELRQKLQCITASAAALGIDLTTQPE
jgi:thiamine kinase-like enzyme